VVAEDFLQAGRELISVRTIPILLPTAAYMLVRVIALNAIIVALGIQHISLVETAGIYTIIVLGLTLGIIPVNLGGAEAIGLGALVAYSLSQPTAALIMLSFRLLTSGMSIVVALVLLFPLWHGRWAAAHEGLGEAPSAGSGPGRPAPPLVERSSSSHHRPVRSRCRR
jgi:hypothetical protein